MQRVSELVEHRRHIIVGQQRRLAGRGLGEVGNVVHHRLVARQRGLIDELIHPGAALLVVPLEVVGVEERQRLTIHIEYLEGPHVGIVDRNVVSLLERQPVQLVGGEKHSVLQHVVQFEVGHDLRFIQIVLRLPHLLGVILPVPRLELEPALLGVDQLLHVGSLHARTRCRWRNQIRQQLDRILRSLGALRLEHVRRPVRVAAHRAARVEDRAGRVVDRVNETRAVVAVEGADERVEVGRAVAGDVDRKTDPRRSCGRDAGVAERKLRDVAEQLATEARRLVVDARVVAGADRHGVVERRAVRYASADAAVHGAAGVTVRGVRRAVEAQELVGAAACSRGSAVTEQDRGGEDGEDAERTRERFG